jgi:hypothetical protein
MTKNPDKGEDRRRFLRNAAVAVPLAAYALSGLGNLPAVEAAAAVRLFKHRLTSGPFQLPTAAVSVDWALINDSTAAQDYRVTVFQYGIGMAKTVVPPGPITDTLDPGFATHNANSVGPVFQLGFYYEVVVECNDLNLLPTVQVWDVSANTIPGTTISSGDFKEL